MGKQSETQLSLGASKERNNLKRPNRNRTVEKPYKCKHCSYACRYNYRLKIHERVHTGEKPFKCPHCPFKTAHKYNLKGHEQWHTGEVPYKCPLCPFAAVRKYRLEIHERIHTGDKPFKCRHCSFKSSYKYSLTIHERTHTGYKPFKCQYCPYVATQMANLIIHERTHSGEGPFKCQRCNYASAQSTGLKIHQKIHIRGDLSKPEHPAKPRSSLAPKKRLKSGRKSLKRKIPPETTTVPSEKYAKITDLDSSRKQGNNVPSHLEDLLEAEEESYCQHTQRGSSDDQEINETSSQARFEIFICKECNYALLSEKELCMHYSFCHKLPVVSVNIERSDSSIQH